MCDENEVEENEDDNNYYPEGCCQVCGCQIEIDDEGNEYCPCER